MFILKSSLLHAIEENPNLKSKSIKNNKLIKNIIVKDATKIPKKKLDKIISPFKNKPLDLSKLNSIADKITELYTEAGYVGSYAYLPNQNIKNKIVYITMNEAKIGKIKITNNAQKIFSSKNINKLVSTYIKKDKVLNIKKLEKLLLLLNERKGITATSYLEHNKTKNIFDLTINIKPSNKVGALVTADNFGNKLVGQNQLTSTLFYNSPFKMGDILLLSLNSGFKHAVTGSIGYSLPINTYGTNLGVNYTNHYYKIVDPAKILLPEGKVQAGGFSISHPIVKQRNESLYFGFTTLFKDLINKTKIGYNSKRKINSINFNTQAFINNNLLYGGKTSFNLDASIGKLKILDANEKYIDSITTKAAGHMQKLNMGFKHKQNFTQNASLEIKLNGQYAFKNLDSLEKMTLGGPNAVRAYTTDYGMGDAGLITSLDFSYKFNNSFLPGQIYIGPFIDYGFIKQNKKLWQGWNSNSTILFKNNYRLAGSGLKVNYNINDNLQLNLTQAFKIPTQNNKKKGGIFWLQLQKLF